MEVLKLAFETVIIGLFALPWLWVMIDLAKPDLLNSANINRLVTCITPELRPPVIGISLFSIVYLLGSMVTPVAHEFLNDPDMLGQLLPPEESIQVSTYKQIHAPITPDGVVPVAAEHGSQHDSDTGSDNPARVNAEFLHDERTVLLRASDGTDRLNRLHEQMTVLQGATFSAFAFTVLCGFAWCGQCRKKKIVMGGRPFLRQQLRCSAALVVSSIFIILAGRSLWADAHTLDTGDMPIAELVLLALGGFGLYVAIFGTPSRLKFHGIAFIFAFCFTLLCYTGYGCTERSYDREVLLTYRALPPAETGDSVRAVARPVLTTAISE
jgi:hypothetical protein